MSNRTSEESCTVELMTQPEVEFQLEGITCVNVA